MGLACGRGSKYTPEKLEGFCLFVLLVFHTWKHFEESQGYVYHTNGWKVLARVEK